MNEEIRENQLEIPSDAALLLFKNDAIEDKCIPSIIEELIDAGFRLIVFCSINLNSDMASRLYEYDKYPVLNDFQICGLRNITGSIILAAFEHVDGDSMRKLASMKGQPHYPYGSSIRSTYSRRVIEYPGSTYSEYVRQVVRNRIHVPMDDHEVSNLKSILSELNITFK